MHQISQKAKNLPYPWKMGQIKKTLFILDDKALNSMILSAIFLIWSILEARAEILQNKEKEIGVSIENMKLHIVS